MSALAKDRNTRYRATGGSRTNVGDVAAATTIYKGALIAKNAAGFVVPASDTAALVVIGVAEEQVINSGANGAKTVKYATNLAVELVNGGGAIVQASKHALCYVADDQTVTTAAVAVNDIPAGKVMEFTTTAVWVFVTE